MTDVITINCTGEVFIPSSEYGFWLESYERSIVKHLERDEIKLSDVELYHEKEQKCNKTIKGYEIREMIPMDRVLNANVLKHFLDNQHLIPKEWKSKGCCGIAFHGTLYRIGGELSVYCLSWYINKWICWHHHLEDTFWEELPAAVLAEK